MPEKEEDPEERQLRLEEEEQAKRKSFLSKSKTNAVKKMSKKKPTPTKYPLKSHAPAIRSEG